MISRKAINNTATTYYVTITWLGANCYNTCYNVNYIIETIKDKAMTPKCNVNMYVLQRKQKDFVVRGPTSARVTRRHRKSTLDVFTVAAGASSMSTYLSAINHTVRGCPQRELLRTRPLPTFRSTNPLRI